MGKSADTKDKVCPVEGKDMVCFAEGQVYSTDFNETGLNDMVVVSGTTGCGKTTSYTESRMLHTSNTSLVVPLAKQRVKDKYAGMFKERGYKVYDLNFAHPEKGDVGYDPMDHLKNDTDVMNLGKSIVYAGGKEETGQRSDPYWDLAAADVISAVIGLVKFYADHGTGPRSFAEVIRLINMIELKQSRSSSGCLSTSLDGLFDEIEKMDPDNQSVRLWKALKGNTSKTGGCLLAIVHAYLDGLASDNVIGMFKKKKKLDLAMIGREKSVVFVTTSPFDVATQNLLNIFYADLFRTLFEDAENMPGNRLAVPVHVICDDFGCTGKINNFDRYISVFRAAGISVSLLLQSETQLKAIYGEGPGTTIINNCDSYLYMGGTDLETCNSISRRMNKPVNTVMSIPLEHVVLFRRGMKPICARRYQTYSDPVYLAAFPENIPEKE
ncbi:MAG: type IV secretory system conjugative DNA transfer family protein [Lachnospiraceae bacterium]|nr:type IV secretory system conjugative DNA transfer family protein [Lachnospiraceae bacterium]